jgi:RimK family alpha-L-glutamate ligase
MKNEIYLTLNVTPGLFPYKNYEIERLRIAAEEKGIITRVVPTLEMQDVSDDDLPFGAINMSGPATETHLRFLRDLEMRGVRHINPIYDSMIADNKMLSYIELKNLGFPIPKTKDFNVWYLTSRPTIIQEIADTIGFPCVIKIPDAGLGWGIHRVMNPGELRDLMGLLGMCTWRRIDGQLSSSLIIQEYMQYSEGRAVRVVVVDGKCIGALYKTNALSWKTNSTSEGWTRQSYEIDPALEKMSIDICKHFNLGFAGIDFHFTETGFAIGEINSSPNMEYFERIFPDVNISQLLIDYLINNTRVR